jgi:hypothetical protein
MKFCAVEDTRNGEPERVIFNLGEDILILNHDWQPDKRYDLWDSWVGKIVDIRGNSPRNTWVVVKWYFSGKDIAEHELRKSGIRMDTSSYGKFERSPSQDHQVISIQSINGKARVVEYDDSSLCQDPIPSESFYVRRAYTSLFGSVTPNLDSGISCICNEPYKPDEPNPMHFCPRPGCRQWYHEDCLEENGHKSKKSPDERIQELLDIPQAHVHRIPPEVLRLACKPIIRGPMHGVAGNVKVMCEANEWAKLYAVTPWSESRPGLVLNRISLDQWLDSLDGIEVEKLIYPDDESDSEGFFSPQRDIEAVSLSYICPSCEKPI